MATLHIHMETDLHFDAERCARWRPLCPEAPGVAGLMRRSPEGTEERQTLYAEVYIVLPPRGPPSEVLGHRCQDL